MKLIFQKINKIFEVIEYLHTYTSVFVNRRMQIRKKWLNQLKNFVDKYFLEYYLASFCW